MATPNATRDEQKAAAFSTVILGAVAVVAVLSGASAAWILAVTLLALGMVWGLALKSGRRRLELEQELRAASGRASRADEDLQRQEAAELAMTSLVQATPEPILATDAQGRIWLCNAAAGALLGLGAQRVLGRPMTEVFTQEEVLRIHGEASRGSSLRREVRVPRPGGVRIWEVAAAPVGDGDPAVVMSIRDITEQARAMQVRSDFAANASHELRTPVAAMRVAMDTLQALTEADEPAVRAKFMGMLARNIERLEAMVRDLLDLSRLESPNLEVRAERIGTESLEADLRPLFEKVLSERKLTLTFDFQGELRELRTDRNLLLLILSNLIDNAAKYAFEGTEVRVVGRESGGGGLRLEVVDQGIGIPLDQQQRIFERYYQVDSARSIGPGRRGTGLGLSIVKHAIRRLGGQIRVESVWQQGTRMIIELPGVAQDGARGTG